jgi:hypothetical protein
MRPEHLSLRALYPTERKMLRTKYQEDHPAAATGMLDAPTLSKGLPPGSFIQVGSHMVAEACPRSAAAASPARRTHLARADATAAGAEARWAGERAGAQRLGLGRHARADPGEARQQPMGHVGQGGRGPVRGGLGGPPRAGGGWWAPPKRRRNLCGRLEERPNQGHGSLPGLWAQVLRGWRHARQHP